MTDLSPIKMRRAFVTGATGSIGIPLINLLLDRGYSVTALARSKDKAHILPKGIKVVLGDLDDKEALSIACKGADCIFHAAGITGRAKGGAITEESFFSVNVKGTKNLLEIAKKHEVRRLVYFSTIALYRIQDSIACEEQEPLPTSIYAKTKLEAEGEVLKATSLKNIEGVILRVSDAYGPNMKGNYLRMLNALKKGRFIPIGECSNRRTLVFEKDVAEAAILASSRPESVGNIYNVTDGAYHTVGEIINTICKYLGRKPPRYHLPLQKSYKTAKFVEGTLSFAGKSLGACESIEKFTANITISGEKIMNELGFKPQYDLDRGWEETIGQMLPML